MINFLLFVIGVLSLAYYWLLQRKNYWKHRNIPHIEGPLLLGNLARAFFLKEHVQKAFSRFYDDPQTKGEPFVGINVFHKPAIVIKDPELVKRVLIKDFNYFHNRGSGFDPAFDPIACNNLFFVNNPVWKAMRNKLTPVFTSGKMKQMFPILVNVGENLNKKIQQVAQSKAVDIDVRDIVGAFTLDSIALVALATETRALLQDKPSDFLMMMSKVLTQNFWKKISMNACFFLPEVGRYFGMTAFSQMFTETLSTLFHEVYNERVESKETRGDLVDALIAVKMDEANNNEKLFTDDVLVAQAAVFLLAGYETTATTSTFAIYELAKAPEVQRKVREEIKRELTKTNGQITYEMVSNNLPYLHQVVKETSRKYPALPFLDRTCTVPPGEDGYSLKPFSDYKIPNGMPVYIPLWAFQNDPEYFPNPEKFDPDRFGENASYNEYTYLPFGTGPRNCIGERFGRTQVLVALIEILRSFRIEANEKTLKKIEFDPETVVLRSKDSISVTFVGDLLL